MIIRVTFKNPDTLLDSVSDAVKASVGSLPLSDEEKSLIIESRTENENASICDNWCEYGEYVTIEFDTEKNTATVVRRR
jgi:hypothetical protein